MRSTRDAGAAGPAVVVAIALAAAVVGLGVLLVSRGGGAAAPAAAPTRAADVGALTLHVQRRPVLGARGDSVVLSVPVASDVEGTVTLGQPRGLPPTVHAPDERTTVPAGKTGALQLLWDGPDCTVDVPSRVLPDLTLPVTYRGRTVPTRLDTSDVDALLRQTWVSGCDIQATPPQGH